MAILYYKGETYFCKRHKTTQNNTGALFNKKCHGKLPESKALQSLVHSVFSAGIKNNC